MENVGNLILSGSAVMDMRAYGIPDELLLRAMSDNSEAKVIKDAVSDAKKRLYERVYRVDSRKHLSIIYVLGDHPEDKSIVRVYWAKSC